MGNANLTEQFDNFQIRENMMKRRFCGDKTGFTLIELLVVISIIALLISILMPALSKVKQAAKKLVCLSNVRRIALAGTIYLLEEEAFPPFRMSVVRPTDTVNFVNEYGRVRPRWPWFFDHGIGPVIDPTPYVLNPGDTFGDADTLIMTNKYFMCPGLSRNVGFDSCDIRNGSYGYNYQYLGNSRVTNWRFRNFPVKSVNSPCRTIMIADSRGAGIPHGEHAYTLDPPKIALEKNAISFAHQNRSPLQAQHSPADARHNGKVNLSFVDGHAESMTLKELGYILDEEGIPIADHPDGSNQYW